MVEPGQAQPFIQFSAYGLKTRDYAIIGKTTAFPERGKQAVGLSNQEVL